MLRLATLAVVATVMARAATADVNGAQGSDNSQVYVSVFILQPGLCTHHNLGYQKKPGFGQWELWHYQLSSFLLEVLPGWMVLD
jgi:hypothetical protein